MKLGISPITGMIFCGKTKKTGKHEEWIGKKEDLTDNAISCVAEHMNYLLKSTEDTQWEFTWKSFGKLSFLNKKGLDNIKSIEKCTWIEHEKLCVFETKCNGSHEATFETGEEFKFCPYCGKPIEILKNLT